MTGQVETSIMFIYFTIGLLMAATVQAGLPEAGGFRYSVNDYNGNEHSHQQNRVGNGVKGQYKVLLPDGRLQTVTYVADEGGYRAKVDYTPPAAPGEATTAGRDLPAASRFSSVVGNGYDNSGGFGGVGGLGFGAPGSYGAGPFGAAAFGSGFGASGFDAGYGTVGLGAGYGAAGLATGFGAAGFGPGYGGNSYNAGYGAAGYGAAGYSSPIFGALGIPIGQSSASPTGYSYGYSTPFSQVYSYSNILGGIGY